MSDSHSLTLYAAGLTVCFAVALLSACGGQNAEPPAPRPVLTVELVSPARASWPEFIVASGEVAPWQEASIGAEVTGVRLDKVLVNVGDVVAEGQLLAQFNEDTLRADLARLDAAIAEATANLEKARADASRADRLEITGALPQQTIQILPHAGAGGGSTAWIGAGATRRAEPATAVRAGRCPR